jgi:pimeloyl-ACP methyl ester carboxylesterase
LKKVLISILVLMTLYSCGSMIRRNIYYPNPTNQLPDLGDQVLFEVPSENRISRGLLVENGNELVVMIHGNGYSLMTEEPLAQELLAEGYSVLLIEFPGYGVSSEYEATERNIYQDTRVLLEHILQQGSYQNHQLILHGRSLGAGVAMEMSVQGIGNRLILLTPFTSTVDIGAIHYPRWLAEWLIEDRYDKPQQSHWTFCPNPNHRCGAGQDHPLLDG